MNLECVRAPPRQIVGHPRTQSSNALLQVPKTPFANQYPSVQAKSKEDQIEASCRRYAMRYYIDVLSRLLTVSTAHNSFVSAFLPMAVESETLTNALIAYASSHMSTANSQYATISMKARSKALSGLSEDFASRRDSIETSIAVCMVLLTSEVCDGNYDAWYSHLLGAKHLLVLGAERGQPSYQVLKDSYEGQSVLRNFAYHDVLGSVTSGRRPIMDTKYLEDIQDVFDTYLGVATPILNFIAAISNLDCDNASSISGSWDECMGIQKGLEAWTCLSVASAQHTHLAYAYRGAALIYLHRKMRHIQDVTRRSQSLTDHASIATYDIESKLRNEASITLGHIICVPVDDAADSALLFPIFMVGGELLEQHEMEIVRERLRSMFEKRHFSNILRAWQTLETLWALRHNRTSTSNERPDWQHIVDNQDMGKLLLT